MQIEQIPLADLRPYERNSRTHDKKQIRAVANSIKEFGFTNPVLIQDDGTIIAGHGRIEAARLLGWDTVPCIRLSHLTPEQARAYVIADNALAELSGWDTDLLKLEIAALQSAEFDLDLLGLDNLDELMAPPPGEGLTDPDDVPDPPEEPVTRMGDIWQLGNHRLMCGDSTSIEAVEKLMDGQKADATFTSPPYNGNTKAGDGDIFTSKKSKKLYAEGYSDNLDSGAYVNFASSVLENCFAVTEGFIFWNVSYNANSRYEYIQQIQNRLSFLIEQICWKKSSTIPFKGSLMRDWEPIYLFSTAGNKLGVDEVVSNHWAVSNTNSQAENHKACFPVELPIKGIELVPLRTGIVFEPFGGSGSTLIACEKTGRAAHLMEIDPKYCDVIVKRWENFTGKKAVLLND